MADTLVQTSVTLHPDEKAEAVRLGINISQVSREALSREIRRRQRAEAFELAERNRGRFATPDIAAMVEDGVAEVGAE